VPDAAIEEQQMNKQQTTHGNLSSFLEELKTGEPVPLPGGELTHEERVSAMSHPGRIVVIDSGTFWWFLDALPPRWMSGSTFVFAEGDNCFRMFWERANVFFVRQLSEDETDLFSHLSGASRSF